MNPRKVELIKQAQNYQLTVDGKPFYIKGAGLDLGIDNIKSLASYGGNAFRTWRVENGERSGLEILNEAHQHGLMVCMGLEVARERHGFDYDDDEAVAQQLAQIKQDILALKDHPALLMWGIGNELNLRHTNPKVWDAVNDLSKMIHEVDPNHPTTTMLAGAEPEDIKLVAKRCTDVDLLSFQVYGEIDQLPRFLSESKFTGAYTVSEWGATGHWESPCTDWKRPVEANSSEKAESYKERYLNYIAADAAQCIGSFVFLWGQKQERTPTWYGVFLENGLPMGAAQVMQYLWTGEWPKHRAPVIFSLTIDGSIASDSVHLTQDKRYVAAVSIDSQSDQPLSYRWEIMREVDKDVESDGGDFEPTPEVVWQSDGGNCDQIQFKPSSPGEYRFYLYIEDNHGNAATANIPILVEPQVTDKAAKLNRDR
ncbi:MAG: glycoside hydrolase family 2 TIM barrel-domain containing protein [Porticoccaceae bacterium]